MTPESRMTYVWVLLLLMFHYICAYFQQCIIALTFRIVYLEIAPFCGAVVQADLMMIIMMMRVVMVVVMIIAILVIETMMMMMMVIYYSPAFLSNLTNIVDIGDCADDTASGATSSRFECGTLSALCLEGCTTVRCFAHSKKLGASSPAVWQRQIP